MGSRDWGPKESSMQTFILLLGILPALDAFCLRNSCEKYWKKAATKLRADRTCAVIFDESCCKDSETHFVIPSTSQNQGKLCGKNPLSSCFGPRLKDDVEAVLVMPGCKLEVWDHGSGLEDAVKEERKSFNDGDYKDQEDRYERNKLVFTAQKGGEPHWVEELDDDFDDMDEDIESYRCTCT